jgi:tetratricopeptide (TPR) repeat protein
VNPAVERAQLLLSHGRAAEAERMLREGLAADPDDAFARALLALCLVDLDRHADAQQAADAAMGSAPDWTFTHYVRAFVLVQREKLAEADLALDQALQLDPRSAEAFALRAAIELQRGNWQAALGAAEEALAIEPDDEGALNSRAQALIKLGRGAEARETMISGLALHPQAPLTHANQGWILLESGDHKGALEHFGEALRLDPTLDNAREGYVTALKARYLLYRLVLGFQFRLARMRGGNQWLVLIGLWAGFRLLGGLGATYPWLKAFVVPAFVLYLSFVLLTWIADPLLNVILRFSPRGKYLLAAHERLGAELMAGLGATGLMCGLTAYFAHPLIGSLLTLLLGMTAVGCLILLIPVGNTFATSDEGQRRILGRVTAVIALAVLAAVIGLPAGNALVFAVGAGVAFMGVILFSWVANFLAIRRPS